MALNQFTSPEGDLDNYLVNEYWLIDQFIGDTLWNWGNNNSLVVLGVGDATDRATPVTTFAGGTNWKQVVSGGFHSAAIKTDGTLWVWGWNGYAQMGDNTTTNRCTPVTTFAGGTNWKQVACGYTHTAAVKTDGTLWTWGRNSNAQLGDNTTTNRLTPVTTFAGGTNWKQVGSGGYRHTAAIKTDGTLWAWGNNAYAQMGDNTTTNRCTPVTTFAGGTNWKQLGCGSRHTAAIKTDGTLWTWGRAFGGALGNNNATNNILTPITTFAGGTNWKQVAPGGYITAAVKTDGTLWTWGRNNSNQLGDNTTINRCTPVTTFAGGTNWKQVSSGYAHHAAIKTDGTLWVWGAGLSRQLGIPGPANKPTPITTYLGGTNWKQVFAGSNQTVAVTSGTDPTLFIT